MIRSVEDLLEAVEHYGFLPFFKHSVRGFSVEELCPKELWFTELDGPWEWKGPAAGSGRCIYGKLFGGKAGFVSREWIPDFLNFRRDGYDFDARCDDGLVYYKDKALYETVARHGVLLSKDLKELCHYGKEGNKGFDTVITRLQMQGYLCVADFVYQRDRQGKPYGWGIAQYTTPEHLFGGELPGSAYQTAPEESKRRILTHLKSLLPEVTEEELQRLIGG